MFISGIKETNKQLIANHFNKYFSEIGTQMAASIIPKAGVSFEQYLKMNIILDFPLKILMFARYLV